MPERWTRRAVAALIACSVAVSVTAQPKETFTNLKVLPKDIAPAELRSLMFGFTRALGVRCTYCHVGEDGKPVKTEDFPKDDKPAKNKARVMMRMVKDLNENYLATLESRAEPPVSVKCVTCHHGVAQPRLLEEVLTIAYDKAGIDSTVARYRSLRDRYYGRYAYDFGDAPLSVAAGQLRQKGHAEDAARLVALNLEMNPNSAFAKRQFANASITTAFRGGGADSGVAAYQSFKSRYGEGVVTEEMLNDVGYQLLGSHQVDAAIAALRLNVAEHPQSAEAYDSLGEAYAAQADWKRATEAYQKSLALDPTNENAKHQLEDIQVKSKQKRPRSK